MKRDSNYVNKNDRKTILILSLVGVIAIIAGVLFLTSVPHVKAKPESFIERVKLANSLTPIYPQVTVVKDKVTSVDGMALTQVAKNTKSDSIMRTKEGVSKGILEEGLAEITKYQGISHDGQDIVVLTVTNTGTSKFYVKDFDMSGETATGMEILEAHALDSDYSAAVYGHIPKPVITQLVVLNPSESLSEYIIGKWTVEATGDPITQFSGGVLFFYDKGDPDYNNGENWGIGI